MNSKLLRLLTHDHARCAKPRPQALPEWFCFLILQSAKGRRAIRGQQPARHWREPTPDLFRHLIHPTRGCVSQLCQNAARIRPVVSVSQPKRRLIYSKLL